MRRIALALAVLVATHGVAGAGPLARLRTLGQAVLGKKAAPKDPRAAALKDALELKALWKARGTLMRSGLPLEDVHARVGAVEDRLLSSEIYAVDARRGARALQTPRQIAVHARFLDRELADFLPGETHEQVRRLLDRALQRVRGKTLYARGGLSGLGDLLEDELVAGTIAGTSTRTAQLAVAVEAVRAAATAQSLHHLGAARPPLEVEYALARDPGLADALEAARAQGVDVYFRRTERTPREALDAINRIAVLTQENYLQNWLPPLLRRGLRPRLTLGENGLRRAQESGLVAADATEASIAAQLDRDVQTIQHAAGRMMGFVLDGATVRQAGLDARLERAVDELRVDHALSRMLFDNADERTHDAQEIVKKMMWVGPVAHGLEALDLGVAAKLFAGSADDLLGEYAEIKALTGSGFSRKEIWKRMKVLAPVFAGATFASYEVEHLLQAGNEAAAGALFGVSAVALSMTTALQSMALYKSAYDTLLREGKIAGKIGPLAGDPKFQAALKALDRTRALLRPEGKAQLLAEVKDHLDGLGEALSAEDKAGILDTLSRLDLSEIDAQVRSPSRLARWKAAVMQDFSNPTRLGILIGSAMAPVAGLVAAKAGLMNNGFAMAAIGSTESLVGGLAVSAARQLDDWKQKRALARKLADVRGQ